MSGASDEVKEAVVNALSRMDTTAGHGGRIMPARLGPSNEEIKQAVEKVNREREERWRREDEQYDGA